MYYTLLAELGYKKNNVCQNRAMLGWLFYEQSAWKVLRGTFTCHHANEAPADKSRSFSCSPAGVYAKDVV